MKIPLKIVTRLRANKSIELRLIQLTAQTRRLMEGKAEMLAVETDGRVCRCVPKENR